jgi:integrase
VGRDRWVGQMYVSGTRRKVTAGTRAEVEAKLDDLRGHRRRGQALPDRTSTFADLVDRYRRMVADDTRARATIEQDAWALNLLTAEFGTTKLTALSVLRVEEGMTHIADGTYGRPLGKLSARRVLSMMKRVLDYAVDRELMSRNPTARLRAAAFGRSTERKGLSLTAEQAAALYEACEGEWIGPYVRLGLVIGARPSELAGLCWDCVDLDAGTVEIRRSRRKVGRDRFEVVDQLKTAGGRRVISLPPSAVDMLRAHRARIVEAQMASATWPVPALVFPSRSGTLLDPPNVRREMSRICRDAGVPVIGPNVLRHTVASLLADGNTSPARLTHLLGHTTPATADRYYVHRVGETADAAMSSMLGR